MGTAPGTRFLAPAPLFVAVPTQFRRRRRHWVMMVRMSETLWWLLTPSTIVALLLVLGYLAARARRGRAAATFLFVPVLLLLVLLVVPIDQYVAVRLENRYPAPEQLPAAVDGIVVLGGSVDWRETQDRRQLALDAAGERMVAALALARAYPEAALVFTGLFSDALSQEWRGPSGARLLFEPELRGRRVYYLGEARSTYEEALLALEQVQPAAGSTWLLVTSALHMPRAYLTFRTQGWTLTPYPVDYRTTERVTPRFEVRIGDRLAALDRAVREWGAYQVYKSAGRLTE